MFTLSTEQIRGMWYVFESCASDYIDAGYEDTGKDTISQDEIVELVLDADRLKTFNPQINWDEFYALPYEERVHLVKSVFVDEEYL